jgi:hypothetical protein
MRGQLIGRIEDFSLENDQRLSMIVSPSEPKAGSSLFSLSTNCIQKVDTANRAVFVDLTQAELERLPVYQLSNKKAIELPGDSPTSSQTPTNVTSSAETMDRSETQLSEARLSATQKPEEADNDSFAESDEESEVVEEEMFRLLEERLVVNRSKRKVGEVIVRKEIETRIVEVPIQREKLIIEQVGSETSETKQLAEIDLGHGEVIGEAIGAQLTPGLGRDTFSTEVARTDNPYTVTGEFLSPQAASNLLEAIALQGRHGCAKVRVELVLDNPELQETYQKMFDRCSKH